MSSKEKNSVTDSVANYSCSKVEFSKGSTISSNTAIQGSTLYFNKSDYGIVKDLRHCHGLPVISIKFNKANVIPNAKIQTHHEKTSDLEDCEHTNYCDTNDEKRPIHHNQCRPENYECRKARETRQVNSNLIKSGSRGINDDRRGCVEAFGKHEDQGIDREFRGSVDQKTDRNSGDHKGMKGQMPTYTNHGFNEDELDYGYDEECLKSGHYVEDPFVDCEHGPGEDCWNCEHQGPEYFECYGDYGGEDDENPFVDCEHGPGEECWNCENQDLEYFECYGGNSGGSK